MKKKSRGIRKKWLHKSCILGNNNTTKKIFLKNCYFGNFKLKKRFRRHFGFSRHFECLHLKIFSFSISFKMNEWTYYDGNTLKIGFHDIFFK
jgi:hypothetical protein